MESRFKHQTFGGSRDFRPRSHYRDIAPCPLYQPIFWRLIWFLSSFLESTSRYIMKVERSERLLSRVIEAGYFYACAADGCLAIFFKSDDLIEHLRNGSNESHERFAAYLSHSPCSECGEVTVSPPDHDYLWHSRSYEHKMRELLPHDIPTGLAVPRFSLCFGIERVFRSWPGNCTSHGQDAECEVSKLCDVIESLHKRLVIMENKFCDPSQNDFLHRAFGSPICGLKNIRLSLEEQSPNPLQCPAPDCQQTFSNSQSRTNHVKTACDERHLFHKSSFDDKYCFQCGEEFSSSDTLATHSQRAHGKTTSSLDTFCRNYSQVAREHPPYRNLSMDKLTVVASSRRPPEQPVNNSTNGAQADHTPVEATSTTPPAKRRRPDIRFAQGPPGKNWLMYDKQNLRNQNQVCISSKNLSSSALTILYQEEHWRTATACSRTE